MTFNTPILLLAFNRPETTEKVFAGIRKIRPRKLFISIDGPRKNHPEDIEKRKQVISIIKKVDWPCELKTLIRNKNLGCGMGPATAIDWFFQNVEEGIILEDDCLPTPDFFIFCSELLEKYRNDERIMHIAGYSFQRGKSKSPYSYYFSNYPYEWGWATWKRSWKLFDVSMGEYPEFLKGRYLKLVFQNLIERVYIKRIMNFTFFKKPDVWDAQWVFAMISNGGLSIVPNKNLVSNIGFNKNATHTNKRDSYLSMPTEKIDFPLKHPPFMIRDKKSDRRYAYWLLYNFIKKKILFFR